MTVFVVVIPHDYQTAEVVGVYTKLALANNARRNCLAEDSNDSRQIQIHEVVLEG